jgi:hypothetical protein
LVAKDIHAEFIANTLYEFVEQGTLKIQRGGYLVKQGRGRLVVTPIVKE